MPATVAMIPALGILLEGLAWDITEKQNDKVGSDISHEPIEDPNKAYLVDFNQDTPAELSLTILSSANPCGTLGNVVTDALGQVGTLANLLKLQACYEGLLYLKRKQTTTPDALIDVYTGNYFYRNMAISNISTSREASSPNVMTIDVDLIEFRFAQAPKVPDSKAPLQSNSGAVNSVNQQVVSQANRPILEAVQQVTRAQVITYGGAAVGIIRGAFGI